MLNNVVPEVDISYLFSMTNGDMKEMLLDEDDDGEDDDDDDNDEDDNDDNKVPEEKRGFEAWSVGDLVQHTQRGKGSVTVVDDPQVTANPRVHITFVVSGDTHRYDSVSLSSGKIKLVEKRKKKKEKAVVDGVEEEKAQDEKDEPQKRSRRPSLGRRMSTFSVKVGAPKESALTSGGRSKPKPRRSLNPRKAVAAAAAAAAAVAAAAAASGEEEELGAAHYDRTRRALAAAVAAARGRLRPVKYVGGDLSSSSSSSGGVGGGGGSGGGGGGGGGGAGGGDGSGGRQQTFGGGARAADGRIFFAPRHASQILCIDVSATAAERKQHVIVVLSPSSHTLEYSLLRFVFSSPCPSPRQARVACLVPISRALLPAMLRRKRTLHAWSPSTIAATTIRRMTTRNRRRFPVVTMMKKRRQEGACKLGRRGR